MAELLAYLAKQLVDEPDAVSVEQVDREGAIVLLLSVAKDDVGKVIGRQGRIARALRAIVRASGAHSNGASQNSGIPSIAAPYGTTAPQLFPGLHQALGCCPR